MVVQCCTDGSDRSCELPWCHGLLCTLEEGLEDCQARAEYLFAVVGGEVDIRESVLCETRCLCVEEGEELSDILERPFGHILGKLWHHLLCQCHLYGVCQDILSKVQEPHTFVHSRVGDINGFHANECSSDNGGVLRKIPTHAGGSMRVSMPSCAMVCVRMRKKCLVIFDFDGVIVETERTTFELYRELLPAYGIHLTEEDFSKKVGRKSIDFLREVMGETFADPLATSLIQKKRCMFLQDVPRYLKPLPGALSLLQACVDDAILMAIGSQNERELLERAVDVFGIRHYFRFIASLQDIRQKKPDPEIFCLVMERMGVRPSSTIVIEDSPQGIEAARSAGCTAIGITTAFPPEKLTRAHHIVHSMEELSPVILRRWVATGLGSASGENARGGSALPKVRSCQ